MVQLKKIILSEPLTDDNGATHNAPCIGIYEVYLTGRLSYLDVGFEIYQNQADCDNHINPIKVSSIGNNIKFDLTEDDFLNNVDWEDFAADKMVDHFNDLLMKGEGEEIMPTLTL